MDNNEKSKVEVSRDNMEWYVKEHKIFMDTCSLMHFAVEKYWENIIPLLYKYNSKIIVPLRAVDEIEKHINNKEDKDLSATAINCKKMLYKLIQAGLVEIRGERTDNFADNVFQVVFTKFRLNYKLLLITQDNDLAKDILALNDNLSVKANPVAVKRINKYGYFSNFYWNKTASGTDKWKFIDLGEESHLPENEVFRICNSVTSYSAEKLRVTNMPAENDYVLTSKGTIRLTKELGAGGEAVVYETDTPYVAKIYKKENITIRKYEKIKLMLSKKIECEGICYPVEILYNKNREFIGYLMPKGKGIELQKSVFAPKPLFLKKFPGWTKKDTVELCITILEKIKYLHDRNVIMGDINPANILVVSPKEVYFVDTDSYQVEAFPCPVGTINYTAPEIQKKHFSDFLRTKGNEYFAVATLLFMIMLPGKPPYSQQGGEDPISNILNMDFSYPFGDNTNKKTPAGPWRYIWSHLTYDLKEAFYNTFRMDGKYSTESSRLTSKQWLYEFKSFYGLLSSGKYGEKDKMSEELFPTRFKRSSKLTYVTCIICKQEVPDFMSKKGVCNDCLDKGESYKCKKCGAEIIYTNQQKYVTCEKKHEICTMCYAKSKEVALTESCVQCGRLFEITNGEYDYYIQKGFDIPKRCKECRSSRKSYGKDRNNSSINIDSLLGYW